MSLSPNSGIKNFEKNCFPAFACSDIFKSAVKAQHGRSSDREGFPFNTLLEKLSASRSWRPRP